MTRPTPSDAEVLSQLAALYDTIDPPPAGLNERVAYTVNIINMQAELAEIMTTESQVLTRTRAEAADSTHTITFTYTDGYLMISVTPEGENTVRVDGWSTPGGITLDLITDHPTRTAIADSTGRVHWAGVPKGPMRFLIRSNQANTRPVLTPLINP